MIAYCSLLSNRRVKVKLPFQNLISSFSLCDPAGERFFAFSGKRGNVLFFNQVETKPKNLAQKITHKEIYAI